MRTLASLAAFSFGAIMGSFLNVCIFRLPENLSIVFPASHCRDCKKPIAWYDNVPILSYFLLKGRCRKCGAAISWQYAFVEFLTALLFVGFYQIFGLSVKGVVYLAWTLALVVESAIDFRHQIIPDEITLPGIVIGLAVSAIFPSLHGQTTWMGGLLSSFFGVLVGGGFLYLAGVLGEWAFKKEAMGGGDVKLLAMIGAVIGWPGVLWTIVVSALAGSVVGVWQKLRGGSSYLPFGPYLALGAFLFFFYGPAGIEWYLRFLGYR